MGNGTVMNNRKKEEITGNKPQRDNEKDKKEVEKMIEQRRQISFTPSSKPSLNSDNFSKFDENKNTIIMNKGFRSLSSAPLKYLDNDALILTDYFDKVNTNEFEEIEKINYKFRHTFYRFKDYQDIEEMSNLKQVKEKLDTEFGFMQSIKNDFEKMKTCFFYCSNLSNDDEKFINQLEFYDFLTNNPKNKATLLNIISKNEKEIPGFISKLK